MSDLYNSPALTYVLTMSYKLGEDFGGKKWSGGSGPLSDINISHRIRSSSVRISLYSFRLDITVGSRWHPHGGFVHGKALLEVGNNLKISSYFFTYLYRFVGFYLVCFLCGFDKSLGFTNIIILNRRRIFKSNNQLMQTLFYCLLVNKNNTTVWNQQSIR